MAAKRQALWEAFCCDDDNRNCDHVYETQESRRSLCNGIISLTESLHRLISVFRIINATVQSIRSQLLDLNKAAPLFCRLFLTLSRSQQKVEIIGQLAVARYNFRRVMNLTVWHNY